MNSFSDSENSFSQVQSDIESDVDFHIFAEQERENIIDQLNEMTKQNTILKAQFEQAVATSKQMGEIMQKNSQLSNQVRNLQLDNDHLQNRLSLSLKSNEELSKQIEIERSSAANQILKLSSQKDLDVSSTQKHCDGKIDSLLIKLKQTEDTKEQLETKNQSLAAKIEKLAQAASQYFNVTFDSIESLTTFFRQPVYYEQKTNDQNLISQQVQFSEENEIEKNERLASNSRKNKRKIKTLKRHCEKFVAEINKLQNEISDSESRHSNEIKSYQSQLKQLKEDLSESFSENKQLESQNRSLNNEFQKLKKDTQPCTSFLSLSMTPQQQQLQQQQQSQQQKQILQQKQQYQSSFNAKEEENMKRKINDLSDEINTLTQKNYDLNKQLLSAEHNKADLISKLRESENQISSHQLTISRLESEKATASVIHNETVEELQSIRDLLRSKEGVPPKDNNKNKKKIEKLQSKIFILEKNAKSQQEQILSQEVIVQNMKEETGDKNLLIKNLQIENKELQEKLQNLNYELIDVNEKLQSKPEITIEDVLPQSSLRYNGFDSVLSSRIETVIATPLSPSIKLSKIYATIKNHYEMLIKEKGGYNDNLANRIQYIKSKVNKFLFDISICLGTEPITFDDFIDRDMNETLLERVSESHKGYEDLKIKNGELLTIANRITEEFGQCIDMPSYITQIRQRFEGQTITLKKYIRKYQDLKRESKAYKRSVDSQISSMSKQYSELSSTMNDLNFQKEDLEKKLQSTKNELLNTKSELESTKNFHSDHTEDSFHNDQDQDMIIQKISQDHINEKSQLIAHIEQMKLEISKYQESITEKETMINRLKALIIQNKNEIKEKDDEVAFLRDSKDITIKDLQHKYETEKAQLVQTYENAIAEIQKRCGSQRQDFEKISSDLVSVQTKAKQSQSTISKLKKEKQRLENELNNMEEQVKREKQIQDVNHQNALTSIEMNYNQLLEEANAKIETEKRKIFNYTADEFKKYCNPNEHIDDRGYRSLISKVKKELEKLIESDAIIRRIAGAVPKQSTDEAVSRLLS